MYASNNKKGILATRILGLFLTAAMPFSFLTIVSPVAIAVESQKEPLDEVVGKFSPKTPVISLEEFSEEAREKATLVQISSVNPTAVTKRSDFNFGHALAELSEVAKTLRQWDFLNLTLLTRLSENSPALQGDIAGVTAAKVCEYYFNVMKFIDNGTISVAPTEAGQYLSFVKRLYDVMTMAFAYQNVYQAQVDFHNIQSKALREKWEEINRVLKFGEDGRTGKNKEKEDIRVEYERQKTELNKEISSTEKTRQAEIEKLDNTTSSGHITTLDNILERLRKRLEELEAKYISDIRIIDEVLADKEREGEVSLKSLEEKNRVNADLTQMYLGYLFEPQGTSLGVKSFQRWWKKLPQIRRDFDYSGFNMMLEKYPDLLQNAKYLMYSKIHEVATSHSDTIEKYSKEDILSSLLNYLGFSGEEQGIFNDRIAKQPPRLLPVPDDEKSESSVIGDSSMDNSFDVVTDVIPASTKSKTDLDSQLEVEVQEVSSTTNNVNNPSVDETTTVTTTVTTTAVTQTLPQIPLVEQLREESTLQTTVVGSMNNPSVGGTTIVSTTVTETVPVEVPKLQTPGKKSNSSLTGVKKKRNRK